ncbi:MAG TPA: hypothetical protein VM554_02425 [Acidisarcina sp.]|nr:hypothetical protein [Acidisarcina sp.]
MNRRKFLQAGMASMAGWTAYRAFAQNSGALSMPHPDFLTSEAEIQRAVAKASPLHGALIPSDIKRRLGATHYGGRYFFTDKPYLVEGAEALLNFGSRSIKLWLDKRLKGYEFHWQYPLGPQATLLDVLKLPAFQHVLDMPFEVYSFEVGAAREEEFDRRATFEQEESEFEALAGYLYERFHKRNVVFILQHWEGDWLLRGNQRDAFRIGNKVDVSERADAMVRWLTARQNGVNRARAAYPNATCRVFHVSEVNRVYDTLWGLPGVITDVIPHVEVDGVSWSSYDGMGSGPGSAVKTWQGLDIIEHWSSLGRKKKPFLMIGEVGLPEHRPGLTPPLITQWWDTAMSVFFAREIPYIFQWELFDNETLDKQNKTKPITDISQLEGFWLIKPDGSLGIGATYLHALLTNPGGRLPTEVRRSAGI